MMKKKQKKKKNQRDEIKYIFYDDVINHIYKICSNGILKMERKLSFNKLWDIKYNEKQWIGFYL